MDWISALDKGVSALLVLCVIAAVVVFIGLSLTGGAGVLMGLLLGVTIGVVGFLSAAAVKVFIGMAKDLRSIRKKMDA